MAASSASIDLRDKRRAYCRNGVREYLVWLVAEARLEWFCLEDDDYRPQLPDAQGVLRGHYATTSDFTPEAEALHAADEPLDPVEVLGEGTGGAGGRIGDARIGDGGIANGRGRRAAVRGAQAGRSGAGGSAAGSVPGSGPVHHSGAPTSTSSSGVRPPCCPT